jgi:capsid protein
MGIKDKILEALNLQQKKITHTSTPQPKASRSFSSSGQYSGNSWTLSFNGEKNLGELGPVIDYQIDYPTLRARSWQAFLESEVAQLVFKKYCTWIISKGLRLKSEPDTEVLRSEGININSEAFNEVVEARWKVWANSSMSTFDNQRNLHYAAKETLKNAIVGGDMLVVLRYENGAVNVQLIDGAHICSPVGIVNYIEELKTSGNKIIDGIEMTQKGEHVAYYVKTKDFGAYDRIPAKNSLGHKIAFMVYGMEYRIDSKRGMPLISTVMETIKKMERYKEATLGSAEERQKIVYQIVHEAFSTGENPIAQQLAKAFDVDNTNIDLPQTIDGNNLANTVAASTNKQTYNMPQGAEMKTLESRNELYFKDFYNTNIDVICAVIGIPPNVAMSMYNDSFSASRAATKDWEHTIEVVRGDFATQFYQPIYNFWLHMEILTNKVSAVGFMQNFARGNFMAVCAYQSARFVGSMFPHIDPLKEVNAERQKLGIYGRGLPLTTLEDATEALGGSEADSNIRQYIEEIKLFNESAKVVELNALGDVRERKREPKED